MSANCPDSSVLTALAAEQAEACTTIETLARRLGIHLRFIGTAGPEYDTPDALLIEFTDPGDTGLMALQEVMYLGPYEFGCDWDWTGPSPALRFHPEERRQYEAAGSPNRYRRAIPVADLNTLVVCLDTAILASIGALPPRWTLTTTRGLWFVTATAVYTAPATEHSATTTIRRRALTRAGARRKAITWAWETAMVSHWEAVEEVAS